MDVLVDSGILMLLRIGQIERSEALEYWAYDRAPKLLKICGTDVKTNTLVLYLKENITQGINSSNFSWYKHKVNA